MNVNKIGRYEIKHQLGRGGMATVYLAYDPQFKREVAAKLLPRDLLHDENFKSRFTREAQTIAALEHTAIVPVYDFGEEQGQPFLIMRHMTGGSLAERIKRGSFSIEESAKILERIGSALDYAHSQGVIHRDLKPGNILFDNLNNSYLADFGIAHLAEASTKLTGTKSIIGTPAYMSPEQIHGDEELDGRSDLYSLGIILFEMLTGNQPFEADTPARVMMKHILDPVPDVHKVRPDLPLGSEVLFSTALAKDREKRYAKAKTFTSDLDDLITQESPKSTFVDETYVESIDRAVQTPSDHEIDTVLEAPPPTPHQLRPSEKKRFSILRQNPLRLLGLGASAIAIIAGGLFLFNRIQSSLATTENILPLSSEPAIGSAPTSTSQEITVELTPSPTSVSVQPSSVIALNSERGLHIASQGVIRIGIHQDGVWPFSIISDGEHTGFELELVKEIVNRLFPSPITIEWIPVTAAERFSNLQANEIDLLVRNATHTTSREELAFWTSNYFLDGLRLLVYSSEGYSELEDMDGAQISVLAGTTNESIINQAVEEKGLNITIAAFGLRDDAMISFESGESVAFVDYWTSLLHFMGTNPIYEIIDDIQVGQLDGMEVGKEPLAIGIPLGEEEFRDEIDAVLIHIIQDGTWRELYDRWFPDLPPWTIEEMLAEPPPNR